MAQINGPRLQPLSGRAKQLVVFLHGYGADGNDLIEIGRQWQRWLPDAAFVAPNAPELCAGAPMGRQWFALTFRDPHERWRGVNQAGPGLDAFLEAELASHNLPASKLALVGFSQGTMMALHVGLRRAQAPAAIVGYSGMVVLEEGKGPDSLVGQVRHKPPLLLVHGDQDDVIPIDALFLTMDALQAAEVPCQWHISAGVAHGIDGEALRQGGLFLAHSLGLPYPKAA
ncbi:MAG TPA: prolyl oligopeptidase family serine peptidase [Microvirga sp.]|jgi:phospholipase/carboxylesterase|nr:prolyl oligopeptidase family serine peptidase [Microvirga sp.]